MSPEYLHPSRIHAFLHVLCQNLSSSDVLGSVTAEASGGPETGGCEEGVCVHTLTERRAEVGHHPQPLEDVT